MDTELELATGLDLDALSLLLKRKAGEPDAEFRERIKTDPRMSRAPPLTDLQRELLEDRFVLWERASREGPMDLRDYNCRAAEALKAALAIAAERG